MTSPNKTKLASFVPETLVYGALTAGFCYGVIRVLGQPLQALFRGHRAEYGLLALALMVAQGFVLERITHGLFELFRRGKARR
jgi:hypothetical protein